jgi:hypothetical protein
MTYDIPTSTDPLQQGDIFFPLPSAAINLSQDPVLTPEKTWKLGILGETGPDIVVQARVRLTWAILTTQDCDAERTPMLSFHSIVPLRVAYRGQLPSSEKRWMEFITKDTKLNPHWFYLPEDPRFGFNERMAVAFPQAFQVRRHDVLENVRLLRKARLGGMALLHFRDCLSRFYTRQVYDEWYPLTHSEREWYERRHQEKDDARHA